MTKLEQNIIQNAQKARDTRIYSYLTNTVYTIESWLRIHPEEGMLYHVAGSLEEFLKFVEELNGISIRIYNIHNQCSSRSGLDCKFTMNDD